MFDIFEFIANLFKKEDKTEPRNRAKDRLKLVLVSDRVGVSPRVMESLKTDMIQVISKYLTIDTTSIEMGLEKKDGSIALAANIPIIDVKRHFTANNRTSRGEKPTSTKEEKPLSAREEKLAPAKEEKPPSVREEKPSPAKEERPVLTVEKTVAPPPLKKESLVDEKEEPHPPHIPASRKRRGRSLSMKGKKRVLL